MAVAFPRRTRAQLRGVALVFVNSMVRALIVFSRFIEDHSCARPVDRNVWSTAPQFCGPKISWICRMELSAKLSGCINVITLALRTLLGHRLDCPLGGPMPFHGRIHRMAELTTEDRNSYGSLFRKFLTRKIVARLARHCRRRVERRNDPRLL